MQEKSCSHFFSYFFINQSMSIPSEYCKSFFNITDVNEMYPHLTRTQAESLKNHFCYKTLYYIGELRGYLKKNELAFAFVCLIDKLKEDKTYNYSHALFFKMLINELNFYKEENFYECIHLLEDYAHALHAIYNELSSNSNTLR